MSSPRVPTMPGTSFRLPPQLEGLRRLAYNLYWSWHPRAKILFSRIHATGWSRPRNPIPVPANMQPWSSLLEDPAFMAEHGDLVAAFDRYVENGSDPWLQPPHR